jgi:hypothetical protein
MMLRVSRSILRNFQPVGDLHFLWLVNKKAADSKFLRPYVPFNFFYVVHRFFRLLSFAGHETYANSVR